jgi:hypothetical protein
MVAVLGDERDSKNPIYSNYFKWFLHEEWLICIWMNAFRNLLKGHLIYKEVIDPRLIYRYRERSPRRGKKEGFEPCINDTLAHFFTG